MYSLLTEFRSGDNIVLTYLEHNSNYVPWYALCTEIAPRFNLDLEYRLVHFDKKTGELDYDDFQEKVDENTKIVCCTGASNFLGTKPSIHKIRSITHKSGYHHPNGRTGSYLLIDGANLLPNASFDVNKYDVDFLAWSFHKILAPVAVGGLYIRSDILQNLRPFQYGGDMIAEGKVTSERVEYAECPWKFTAGTPNIIGTILSGAVIDLIPKLILKGEKDDTVTYRLLCKAMNRIKTYEQELTQYLLDELATLPGIDYYGSMDASQKTPLFSFNINGRNPMNIAKTLDRAGIEVRAGCHCATLAHYYLGLNPPASCRISPYFYNTQQEMEYIIREVKKIVSDAPSRSVRSIETLINSWIL